MKRGVALAVALASAALGAEGMEPLCADESAALRFLEFVSGPMSATDETEWWGIGGRQFGLFAKRYNIAFAGYAAAALGMRGTDEERKTVGRILDNCVRRILALALAHGSSFRRLAE